MFHGKDSLFSSIARVWTQNIHYCSCHPDVLQLEAEGCSIDGVSPEKGCQWQLDLFGPCGASGGPGQLHPFTA